MDEYNLINSKAISEHCRKIQHKFNLEEIAILIYRSKKLDIKEKIIAYNELIKNYDDMPMIKHLHCGPYDSIKKIIKKEIERLEDVCSRLKMFDENSFYQYGAYYISSGRFDLSRTICRKYEDAVKNITTEIEEYNDIAQFEITKKIFNNEYEIKAEFYVRDKKIVMVNAYDSDNDYPDIGTIFVNIPTPFKKGDLLYSNFNAPFYMGFIPRYNNVFCLDWMATWREDIDKKIMKGCFDDSDMMGSGYYIYEGDLMLDHCYEYDTWEYFEGKLTGMERILTGTKNLLRGEITIDLFVQAYNVMRKEYMHNHLAYYTYEGRELAGFNKEDIEKLKMSE